MNGTSVRGNRGRSWAQSVQWVVPQTVSVRCWDVATVPLGLHPRLTDRLCSFPHRLRGAEYPTGGRQEKFLFLLYHDVCAVLRRVQLFATPWTVAHQAPLSMGFFRHEYCSGLPCPPPGHLPGLGTEPTSLMSPASAGDITTSAPGKAAWETGLLFCPCCLLFNALISQVSIFHL